MILHFSHIGLTEGRTFMLVSLFFSDIRSVPQLGSGDRYSRRYQAEECHAAQQTALRAHPLMLARAEIALGSVDFAPQAAARPLPASCHGVRIRGPSAVIAIVNSKCAASDPSCE